MLWIILGSIIDLASLMGLLGSLLPDAPKSTGGIIGLIVFLLAGAGLIIVGVKSRKAKKEQEQLLQQAKPLQETLAHLDDNIAQTTDKAELNGLGLLIIDWNKKTMANDWPARIFLDKTLIAAVNFSNDQKITVTVSQGMHQLNADFLGAPATSLEVKAGQTVAIRLEYSRKWGRLNFESPNCMPASLDNVALADVSLMNRRRLAASCSDYLAQGYQLYELTDKRAEILLTKNISSFYWFILFLLGILPAVIYYIIRSKCAKILLYEVQPDGIITNRIIKGKDVIRIKRNDTALPV